MDKNKIILEKKKLSPARSNNTCKVRSIQHSVQHITFNKWKLKDQRVCTMEEEDEGADQKVQVTFRSRGAGNERKVEPND